MATSESTAPAATDFTSTILHALGSATGPLNSGDAFPTAPFADLKAALDRLASRNMVEYEAIDREEVLLEPEGAQIVEHGSHEVRVFEALRRAVEGLSIQELEAQIGDKTVVKAGQGNAFKAKWIAKGQNGKFVAKADSVTDSTREQLQKISETRTHEPAVVAALKKRKLVKTQKVISFKVSKGEKFALELVKEETDLTVEMLATGSWKDSKFKPYNFKALGADQTAGALHPLNKVRTEFRQIFFEMGFTEMSTASFVESGFWCFDALFVPQQHPARDMQDTFFISDPPTADRPQKTFEGGVDPETLWNNVKTSHEGGAYGSIGYRYNWAPEESTKLVLRTHTTATSAAMLWKLASQKGPDGRAPPARYFSIDRVFRNETVDATHLAEFHQVEGVVADYGLTLGGLQDLLTTFFEKMGLRDLKFKPTYNPYTEPSMEVYAWHSGLGKLVEIGNSGMFRPEMLEALGLPSDMKVYGWGLSLERPEMIRSKIKNIRELLGHKVDLNFVARNPAVRFDKM